MASTPATTRTASDDPEDQSKAIRGCCSQLPTRVSNACERCRRNKSRVSLASIVHNTESCTEPTSSVIPSGRVHSVFARMSSARLAASGLPPILESKYLHSQALPCTRDTVLPLTLYLDVGGNGFELLPMITTSPRFAALPWG